jgi:glycerophosphoryl diester phosphodiesterase
VNEDDEMRKLLEAGVDGIITDFPDRLKSILDEQRGSLREG